MLIILVFALSVYACVSETLDRHRRGDKIYAKSPDDRCGHQICPPGHIYGGDAQGYTEPGGVFVRGRICHTPAAASYGRGAGYGWNWGDTFGDLFGPSMERCIKDNPIVGCEWNGWLAYPKCEWGFQSSGCCVCRHTCAGKWVRLNNGNGACLLPCTSA